MKFCYMFVILAAFFMAIGEGSNNDDIRPSKRFLRTAEAPDNDIAAEEERGVGTTLAAALAKLQGGAKIPLPKNAQFNLWRKAKWDYHKLMSYYGFKGKDKALYENNPIYHRILDYSANYLRKHNVNGIFA